MATVTIGDWTFPAIGYSETEDSTPIAAGDTSGGVGMITVQIAEPDPYLTYAAGSGYRAVQTFGEGILRNRPLRLNAPDRGEFVGQVASVSRSGSGDLSIVAPSRLNLLNVFNIQAQPYVGTLGNAFAYYLSLAGVTDGYLVDPSLAGHSIAAPGWFGDLWHHLKMMVVAEECEIALVDGIIHLRPVRQNYILKGREIGRSSAIDIGTLAQAVEVYTYNTQHIVNELVYPVGGWVPETEVLNVNAGEDAEYTLDLGASVSSIHSPTMVLSVDQYHDSSSVYTIVANDGLPVPPAQWIASGGSLSVTINPDTTSLSIKLRGAMGIGTSSGQAATSFSVALGSSATGNRYSTLRIVGTGVSFNKEKVRIGTGVPKEETATEIGVTIDNPFFSDLERAYRAGVYAAADFAGTAPSLNAELVATHSDMQGKFGMSAGARIWNSTNARWHRVDSATISPTSISGAAKDDTTIGDREDVYGDRTIGAYEDFVAGLTIGEGETVGLRA